MLLALLAVPGLASLAAPVSKSKGAQPSTGPAAVSFNRDIRAILTDNCFTCHGPDHNKRMANLRLDLREDAVAHGAIVPGKPQASKLIARVFATDAARVMPPVSTHKQLTPAQKDLLRRWIAQGAKYEPHWAFVPLPKSVPLPAVHNAAWCRSPIDRFVLARLEAEHLKPSPEASRSEWLRRVTLDLTGLPPTIAETDAFLADRSPDAYEKVVDRLLASPHYGERMAQPWLDVARYADSYGYQSDQLCPTWPYRDWVVKAFNDNLPYDKFITWQLAGDLLPNATREQRLATAFNRLHRMTNEGGSVPEEWRIEGIADRVATFGTAFLGLTTECARCHDHKYDPISQKDYYSLSAFFNSIDEYGMYDRAPGSGDPGGEELRRRAGGRRARLSRVAGDPSHAEAAGPDRLLRF
jgi:cytochrome c553